MANIYKYGVKFSGDGKTLERCPYYFEGSYTIPEGVTTIGDCAFEDCENLTSITISNSVTSIEEYAFYCCMGLTSVNIPNSVMSIGHQAFAGCSGLTSITIPNSVTSIGESAFSHCTSLTSVTIPESVTNIGEQAFYCCTSLTSMIIHGTEYKTHEIKDKKAIAYKGFKTNMKCRDFQYAEGETFVFDGEPELCSQGFHACLSLGDVFNYYYGKIGHDFMIHEVVLEGITDERSCDSKVVGKIITIGKRVL